MAEAAISLLSRSCDALPQTTADKSYATLLAMRCPAYTKLQLSGRRPYPSKTARRLHEAAALVFQKVGWLTRAALQITACALASIILQQFSTADNRRWP